MKLAGALGSLATATMLILLSPARTSAQEDESVAEARTRFELAERHFEDGDYALALSEFERVHELMRAAGHPNASYVLYNVAFSNEQLGRDAAAVEAYERFLAESDRNAPNRADAQRRLRELRRRLELADQDRASEESSGDSEGLSPVGIVVTSTGGAAVAAGALLGAVAFLESENARADCVDSACPESARQGIASAQTVANIGDALLFGGLAVAAAGIVLMLVLPDKDEVEASAACTEQGCMATVRTTL
jgi:tetratricopeptide (TPR) repeat protein